MNDGERKKRGRQLALQNAFESAVVMAARDRGANPKDFGEALEALPREVFEELRAAYAKQLDSLESPK